MERLGIPSASIITHVFLNTAKAMTRMMGVPDYEFVVAAQSAALRHSRTIECCSAL